eukprot:CAMPEP_0194512186 /NCGR_PEP_ID=MMETSP0253-20130528/44075_1 /TAXON_ID=2966 /ORGANISM="Noctiluca scintillans" /LENGTH=448 /DNA_ID=CAMNT_0039355597 /DNA_START=26 /DNA_END=1368 /DNA_ORIENTATION=+
MSRVSALFHRGDYDEVMEDGGAPKQDLPRQGEDTRNLAAQIKAQLDAELKQEERPGPDGRVPGSSPSLGTRDSKPDPQTMFDVRASPKLGSRLDSKERQSVKEVAVNADEVSGTGGDSAGRRRRRRTGSDNDGSSDPAFFSKPEPDGVAKHSDGPSNPFEFPGRYGFNAAYPWPQVPQQGTSPTSSALGGASPSSQSLPQERDMQLMPEPMAQCRTEHMPALSEVERRVVRAPGQFDEAILAALSALPSESLVDILSRLAQSRPEEFARAFAPERPRDLSVSHVQSQEPLLPEPLPKGPEVESQPFLELRQTEEPSAPVEYLCEPPRIPSPDIPASPKGEVAQSASLDPLTPTSPVALQDVASALPPLDGETPVASFPAAPGAPPERDGWSQGGGPWPPNAEFLGWPAPAPGGASPWPANPTSFPGWTEGSPAQWPSAWPGQVAPGQT